MSNTTPADRTLNGYTPQKFTVKTPTSFRQIAARITLILTLSMVCACSSNSRLFTDRSNRLDRETVFIHHVKYDGENLSMLAAWYFEDEAQWPLIAKYNGTNAEQNIHIGQSIILPEKGLKKNEQLPHEFALAFLQKVKSKPLREKTQGEEAPLEANKEELVDEFMKKALDEASR